LLSPSLLGKGAGGLGEAPHRKNFEIFFRKTPKNPSNGTNLADLLKRKRIDAREKARKTARRFLSWCVPFPQSPSPVTASVPLLLNTAKHLRDSSLAHRMIITVMLKEVKHLVLREASQRFFADAQNDDVLSC
jgi:hypothetical protein